MGYLNSLGLFGKFIKCLLLWGFSNLMNWQLRKVRSDAVTLVCEARCLLQIKTWESVVCESLDASPGPLRPCFCYKPINSFASRTSKVMSFCRYEIPDFQVWPWKWPLFLLLRKTIMCLDVRIWEWRNWECSLYMGKLFWIIYTTNSTCRLLLGMFFDHEDVGNKFLWNVGDVLPTTQRHTSENNHF